MGTSKKLTKDRINQIANEAFMQRNNNPAREVVFSLLRHINALDREIDSLIKSGRHEIEANDRLTDNILQLQREKRRLQDEVDAVREVRKVSLPKEMAEAIERLRLKDLTDIQIIRLSDQWAQLWRDYPEEVIEDLKLLRKFQLGDVLLSSFVNGYTVEQTPDDHVLQECCNFLKNGQDDAVAAVEMVLGIFKKDELLHRLRNEVH